jgi:hypothetical protein
MYTNYGIGNAGISDTVWFSNPNAFGVQYNGPAGTAYPFYFDDAGDGNPTTCNKLCFNVAGFFINAMTIQGDGNVGIGTTSPDALLELSSSTKQSLLNINKGDLYVSSSGYVGIGTTNPTQKLYASGNAVVEGWLQAFGSNFGVGNNSYGVFLGTYSGGTSISPGEIIFVSSWEILLV